jgi:hypothetical protein
LKSQFAEPSEFEEDHDVTSLDLDLPNVHASADEEDLFSEPSSSNGHEKRKLSPEEMKAEQERRLKKIAEDRERLEKARLISPTFKNFHCQVTSFAFSRSTCAGERAQ